MKTDEYKKAKNNKANPNGTYGKRFKELLKKYEENRFPFFRGDSEQNNEKNVTNKSNERTMIDTTMIATAMADTAKISLLSKKQVEK
ncbi:hypothetical protein MASR2M39_29910 [Ignavibacteriales bacterium]